MNDHNLKKEIISEILKTYQELPDEFYAHALFIHVRAKVFKINMRFPYAGDEVFQEVEGRRGYQMRVRQQAEIFILKGMNDSEKLKVILNEVCRFYGQDIRKVKGKCRDRELVTCRQVFCYLARRMTNMTTTRIGDEIGSRDHATVLHSVQSAINLRDYNGFRPQLQLVESQVENRLMELGNSAVWFSMGSLTWSEL